MRRYNIALACAHTSKGCHYGIPATRDEIGERCRGAFSNALLDLPPSAFNEAIGVLASLAEQANAVRIDDEDDALFVDVYYLRRVAKERHELMDFIEALERIEVRRLRERIVAEANVATPSATKPHNPGWRSFDLEEPPLRENTLFKTEDGDVFVGTFEGYGTANDVDSSIINEDTIQDEADDLRDAPVFFQYGEYYDTNGHAPIFWSYIPVDLASDNSAAQPATPPTDPAPPTVVSCNKHTDCDAADIAAKARDEERGAVHCHDDCCEDCFGS